MMTQCVQLICFSFYPNICKQKKERRKKKDFSRSTTPYCREGVRRQGKNIETVKTRHGH